MKYACLFRENEEPILVSAEDIKNGIYSKDEEFIDPEYEFRVIYVKGARNNGGPHFRLYLSREDYNKLSPKRKSRYDYLRKMRHFDDSEWHKKWKQLFSGICDIEKCIKNESNGRWKFADAFYNKTKTCIEFQHSYIAFDFEERNEFYSNLSIKTIWLYDLSNSNVCEDIHGNIEILEDNAKGFFRISEVSKNLSDHYVYIQVKSGVIYRVSELNRREIPGNLRSTIRYFALTEKYTENEFIEAIKMNTIGTYSCKEKIENGIKSHCGFLMIDKTNISKYKEKQTIFSKSK